MLRMLCRQMSFKDSYFCRFIITFSAWVFYTFMNWGHMLSKMYFLCGFIVTVSAWVFYTFMGWISMFIKIWLTTETFITFLTLKLFVCNCWNYILTSTLIIILFYFFPWWIVTSFIIIFGRIFNFCLVRGIVKIESSLLFSFSNSFSFWRWEIFL